MTGIFQIETRNQLNIESFLKKYFLTQLTHIIMEYTDPYFIYSMELLKTQQQFHLAQVIKVSINISYDYPRYEEQHHIKVKQCIFSNEFQSIEISSKTSLSDAFKIFPLNQEIYRVFVFLPRNSFIDQVILHFMNNLPYSMDDVQYMSLYGHKYYNFWQSGLLALLIRISKFFTKEEDNIRLQDRELEMDNENKFEIEKLKPISKIEWTTENGDKHLFYTTAATFDLELYKWNYKCNNKQDQEFIRICPIINLLINQLVDPIWPRKYQSLCSLHDLRISIIKAIRDLWD